MVKAELTYNPYLLKTEIRFNGQLPRINSLVEKYQSGMLEAWIHILPKVFYDEMNGYDFELDFTGTRLDFEEVVDSFRIQGVDGDQVTLFHKNELNDRITKMSQIKALIQWLKENPIGRFDAEAFFAEHAEVFDDACPFILIHGQKTDDIDFGAVRVSGEIVSQVEDLDTTVLKYTPILFWIDRSTAPFFQKELAYILKRSDVKQNQLFFMVDSLLDESMVERVIQDLGIRMPQMVHSINDDKILKYLKLYPISDYICNVIRVFQKETDRIGQELKDDSLHHFAANQEIHRRIDEIESQLECLKNASYQFINRDNLERSTEWDEAKFLFFFYINNWKNRKTKITGETEGMNESEEFKKGVETEYWKFVRALSDVVLKKKESLFNLYDSWYKATKVDPEFIVKDIEIDSVSVPAFPETLAHDIYSLLKTEYLPMKNDLVGRFLKNNSGQRQMYPATVFYYQEWREYVLKTMTPLAENYVKQSFEGFSKYCDRVAEAYRNHLEMLIRETEDQKIEISSKLSDEDMIVQKEEDWLAIVCDQLKKIARE